MGEMQEEPHLLQLSCRCNTRIIRTFLTCGGKLAYAKQSHFQHFKRFMLHCINSRLLRQAAAQGPKLQELWRSLCAGSKYVNYIVVIWIHAYLYWNMHLLNSKELIQYKLSSKQFSLLLHNIGFIQNRHNKNPIIIFNVIFLKIISQ